MRVCASGHFYQLQIGIYEKLIEKCPNKRGVRRSFVCVIKTKSFHSSSLIDDMHLNSMDNGQLPNNRNNKLTKIKRMS